MEEEEGNSNIEHGGVMVGVRGNKSLKCKGVVIPAFLTGFLPDSKAKSFSFPFLCCVRLSVPPPFPSSLLDNWKNPNRNKSAEMCEMK